MKRWIDVVASALNPKEAEAPLVYGERGFHGEREFHRTCPEKNRDPMLGHLADLCKLGWGPDQLQKVVDAAEKQQILAFESGWPVLVGHARRMLEILEAKGK